MSRVPFLRAFGVLLRQSILTVLSDYSETAHEDISDLMHELDRAGLTVHDLTGEAGSEYQGVFICRRTGTDVAPVALIKIPRELDAGGFAVDICRFDRDNKTYTLVMKPLNSPN